MKLTYCTFRIYRTTEVDVYLIDVAADRLCSALEGALGSVSAAPSAVAALGTVSTILIDRNKDGGHRSRDTRDDVGSGGGGEHESLSSRHFDCF